MLEVIFTEIDLFLSSPVNIERTKERTTFTIGTRRIVPIIKEEDFKYNCNQVLQTSTSLIMMV